MKKTVTKEIYKDGQLIGSENIEVTQEPNWAEYRLSFFVDEVYNSFRLAIKTENSASELAATRLEDLAAEKTERFDIFVVLWNQMINSSPPGAKALIVPEVIHQWQSINEKAGMPFLYDNQGFLKISTD